MFEDICGLSVHLDGNTNPLSACKLGSLTSSNIRYSIKNMHLRPKETNLVGDFMENNDYPQLTNVSKFFIFQKFHVRLIRNAKSEKLNHFKL